MSRATVVGTLAKLRVRAAGPGEPVDDDTGVINIPRYTGYRVSLAA